MIVAGSHVGYSLQFLASIGMTHSELAHARGRVTSVSEHGIASVLWDSADIPERVAICNLAEPSERGRFYAD